MQEVDNNPVWEEISPLIWRNSIYSEEASANPMGKLFTEEIALFKEFSNEIPAETKKILIEVG